jgi:O-antigen ligase
MFPAAVLVLPLYATIQAVPLPLALVRLVSPARAELHDGVAGLVRNLPPWAPLSVAPESTFDFSLRLAAYAAVYWVVRGLAARLPRNGFAVVAPVVCVAAVQAVIVLAQCLRGEVASGSYVNRNHVAGLLEMALPCAVVCAVSRWEPRGFRRHGLRGVGSRMLVAAVAIAILCAIPATRSRGGLAATLVSLLVVGLALLQRSVLGRSKWLAAAALPALLAAAFLYLPSENLVHRYGNVFGADALRREGRVLLWRETLDLVAAYPLVGCGLGAFEPAFLRYKRSAPMVADPHAHNDYLELLAEAGGAGFILCVVLAAGPIGSALGASHRGGSGRQSAVATACIASLAAILTHGFVDFNLRIPANGMVFFWLLGTCSASAVRGNPPTVDC